MDSDWVSELLDRVIQRIFAAGLVLHGGLEYGLAAQRVARALEHLDVAVDDIRTTVFWWNMNPDGGDLHPADSLRIAIDGLVGVADALRRLAFAEDAVGDQTRWMATHDADHAVRRALIVLLDSSAGRVDLAQHPPAREPGAGEG